MDQATCLECLSPIQILDLADEYESPVASDLLSDTTFDLPGNEMPDVFVSNRAFAI